MKAVNGSFEVLLLCKMYGVCAKGLNEMVIEFTLLGSKVLPYIFIRNTKR